MREAFIQPQNDTPVDRPEREVAPPVGQALSDPGAPIHAPWAGFRLGHLPLEVLLYTVLFLVALVVRLAGLDQWPLTEVEANTALAAWRTVRGSAWRPAYYLPLLYDANLLLFWVSRATDTATRLLPALAGAGLVLLPYAARDLLGRRAALLAALLLALAPSWVYFSRSGDGAVLAAAAGALLSLSAYRAVRSKNARDFHVGAVALALGLTAGPQIYTTLLAGMALVVGWAWLGRRDGRWQHMRDHVARLVTRDNALIFVCVLFFFAGGLTFNPSGIGATLNLAGRWAADLSPASSGLPWYSYLRNLLLYEFLIVALATVGGVWGAFRRDALDYVLLAWAGLSLLLGIAGHREPMWLLGALLPLTLLAARGADKIWEAMAPGAAVVDLAIIGVLVPVLAFIFLQVAAFTYFGQTRYLDFARVVLGALLVLWAAYAIWGRRESAQRIGVALLLLVLSALTLRATTAVAYQTGRDPREPLARQGPATPSVQIRDLQEQVTTLSSRQVGDPNILSVDYEEALDPWASWYLRDYPNSRAVPAADTLSGAAALLTPLREQDAWPVGYMAQSFYWQEDAPGGPPDLRQRLRWFIYREPWGASQARQVQLWVRSPAAQTAP